LAEVDSILDRRRAGVLLHITSLPSPSGTGDLGDDAHHFVDFLAEAGLSVWQTLPIGPTHGDRSPYQCMSAHAGNPEFISLEWLVHRGWITPADMSATPDARAPLRQSALSKAFIGLVREPEDGFNRRQLRSFERANEYWLDDYALFICLREKFGNTSWQTWPDEYRDRKPDALMLVKSELSHVISKIKFEQFVFFSQWNQLRRYANQKGVLLFGDMPIFVALDSADVWANKESFDLDEQGNARVVAGVPPDYFSATGQRWGNPHYNWQHMEETGFQWWMDRLKTQLNLYDLIRIDHFRGFEAYWEISANEPTAINGRWVKAPGEALLRRIYECFGSRSLPLVAENLGVITEEVEALRAMFEIPGMLILQFAFDGGLDNPYLPANHRENEVVYTGTHDNDTTVGWYAGLSDSGKRKVLETLGEDRQTDAMPWSLIASALNSKARLAMIPMQDFLELGADARMNTPGTLEDRNWSWQFAWSQLPDSLAHSILTRVREAERTHR